MNCILPMISSLCMFSFSIYFYLLFAIWVPLSLLTIVVHGEFLTLAAIGWLHVLYNSEL